MLKKSITLITILIFLSSCATGGGQIPGNPCQTSSQSTASKFLNNPFTTSLVSFGGNLLATAAANYSQKYTGKLDRILTKLVTPKSMRRNRQRAQFPQNQFPINDQGGFQDQPGFEEGFDPNQDQFPVDDGQGFSDEQGFGQGNDPNQGFDDQFQGGEETFQDGGFQDQPGFEEGFDQGFDPQFADQPVSRGVPGRFPVGQQDPCAQMQQGQGQQPYESYPEDGYPGGGQQDGEYYPDQGYDQQNDAYDQQTGGYDQQNDEYNQQQAGTYDQQSGEYNQQTGAYDQEAGYESQQGQAMGSAIGLDVALVRKTIRNGTPVILPIKDGDLLRDGRGNPQAGDKFRIMFRANSDAHVYVIAVDGSGWAQGIFPTPTSPFANPVKANQQHVVPEGSNWFSLDQFKGIETIFFVASHEPRKDLEDMVKGIMGRERPASASPRQVTKAPIIPNGFGRAQPSQTPFGLTLTSGGQHEILPTSFLAKTAGEDLRITRWFRHQ